MSNILIMSTILILAVIVLRAAFGKRMSMRLRYALWLPVAVRLLLPFQVGHSAISAENVIKPEQVQTTVIVYERPEQQISQAPTVVTVSEEQEAFPLQVIWYAGMAATALWFLGVNVHFYIRARKGAKRLNQHGLRVYVSEGIASPCQIGCSIFVTPEVAQNESHLRHVLAHEKTHFYHGDAVWSLLRAVLLCVYWFFPPIWLAAILSKRDCELACDEGALRKLGEQERFAYGKTLLSIAAQASVTNRIFCTATTMSQSKRERAVRIKLIAARKKAHILVGVLMIALVGVAAVCTFTGRIKASDKPSEEPKQSYFADDLPETTSTTILPSEETQETATPAVKPRPEKRPTEVTVNTEPITQTTPQTELQAASARLLGEYTIKVGEQLAMTVVADRRTWLATGNGAVVRAELKPMNYQPHSYRFIATAYSVGTVEIYFENSEGTYSACIVHVVADGEREEVGFAEYENRTPEYEQPTSIVPIPEEVGIPSVQTPTFPVIGLTPDVEPTVTYPSVEIPGYFP